MRSIFFLFLFFTFFGSTISNAIEKEKGILNELELNEENELENQKKLIASELMIQNSEIKAIESLKKIIDRKKNTPEEPDLLFRLGEMHLKRARTIRNLDLAKSGKIDSKFKNEVRTALDIFSAIEKRFPKYIQLDSVLFAHAFAANQVGLQDDSIRLYQKILSQFLNSSYTPDVTLELGEIYYNSQKYSSALNYFEKIEKYPTASVYMYGKYKTAWTLYNLRQTRQGMERLIEVANKSSGNDETRTRKEKSRHNLRKEALRDITIFASEVYQSNELYSFFKKITQEEEFGPLFIELGKLYSSHSKHKEILDFLSEFIQKESSNTELIRAYNLLIESQEALKERTKVISQLEKASQLCQWKSQWRKSVPMESANNSCKEFKELSYDISSKWWDIWLKNKNHKEFSNYTLQAFKVIVENDDEKNPDLKAHYAYAELLFQMELFDESSSEYLFVGKRSEDPQVQHDANYSALYAKEKSYSKEKSEQKRKEIQEISKHYITVHPNGKYAEDVQFKLGLMAYEKTGFEEASRWLLPLIQSSKSVDLKLKAQDLYLDILNLKKDYVQLKEMATEFSKNTENKERKKSLNKIAIESHFNQTQDDLKNTSNQDAQKKLKAFIAENPQHELSKKAHWQLIGLLYKDKKDIEGNEVAMNYCQQYKQDEQCVSLWQEVVDKYTENKQTLNAIPALEKLLEFDKKNHSKYLQTLTQIYILEKQEKPLADLLPKALGEWNAEQKSEFILRFYALTKESPNLFLPIQQRLKKEVLQMDLEPLATRFMTETALQLHKDKKHKEAFDLSLKILKRSSAATERAPARLIQAQILQSEFEQQSLKSKIDRMALVLSLKTEKLDKAQQAFISVLNMSENPKINYAAMKGLEEIYDHFTGSLQNMVLPQELSPTEQETLKGELSTLAQPILEKSKEIKEKIQEFSKKHPVVLEKPSGPLLSFDTQKNLRLNFSYKFVKLYNNFNRLLVFTA